MKLLWPCGGRYASCVHAGGLSCFITMFVFLEEFLRSKNAIIDLQIANTGKEHLKYSPHSFKSVFS